MRFSDFCLPSAIIVMLTRCGVMRNLLTGTPPWSLWIIHRLHCQQCLLELLSTKEMASKKAVRSVDYQERAGQRSPEDKLPLNTPKMKL